MVWGKPYALFSLDCAWEHVAVRMASMRQFLKVTTIYGLEQK